MLAAIRRASSRGGLFFPRTRFRRLIPSPRCQTADDHKRDQDGSKESQFQTIPHPDSSSPLNRPGWLNLAAGECPSISAAASLGSLAMFTAIRNASSRVSTSPSSAGRAHLEIDTCQRLLVGIPHDEASFAFLDRPGRREAAGSNLPRPDVAGLMHRVAYDFPSQGMTHLPQLVGLTVPQSDDVLGKKRYDKIFVITADRYLSTKR